MLFIGAHDSSRFFDFSLASLNTEQMVNYILVDEPDVFRITTVHKFMMNYWIARTTQPSQR